MLDYGSYCSQLVELEQFVATGLGLDRLVTVYRRENCLYLKVRTPEWMNTSVQDVDLSSMEFKIVYSHIYKEPQLLFRLWVEEMEPDIDIKCSKIWYSPDISSMLLDRNGLFTIELDTLSNNQHGVPEAWYSVHACDTAHVVGNIVACYMERWASVYLIGIITKR